MLLWQKLETLSEQLGLDSKEFEGLVKVQRPQPVKLDEEVLKRAMLKILQGVS